MFGPGNAAPPEDVTPPPTEQSAKGTLHNIIADAEKIIADREKADTS